MLVLAVALLGGTTQFAWAMPFAQMSSDTGRAVAGSLGEDGEKALFGALGEVSVQVADRYDQWVRTGNDEHRAAASAAAESILPLLEKLRAYHQGRLDKAQADIIRDDGNPEVLYDQHWWQVDRGFALAAAGQLSWLHYRLALLNPGKAEQRKGWLKKSVAEFSEFVAAGEARMRLESLLGRGMAEKELGDREGAEADLQMVLQQSKDTPLYWPARLALGELRASAGGAAGLAESAKLLAEAQGARLPAATLAQVRLLRLDALLVALAASDNQGQKTEAASLAAQLSSQGPEAAARVQSMVVARLKDPSGVLGAGVSSDWIRAENLAAAEKFEEAAAAYTAVAASADPTSRLHADEVHHRLGVCWFRLGRYADAERELRAYLAAAPGGPLASEAAYLQLRAAEGLYRQSPDATTRSTFLAVAAMFVKDYPEHEFRYEGLFRYGELLADERRYREAADAFAQVEGPPAFRLRAASGELQALADALATDDALDADAASALRTRAEAAWVRFDKAASAAGSPASEDLKARAVVARAIAAGTGAGADATRALALLDGFEKRFPAATALALPVAALRTASAVALDDAARASTDAAALLAMPGTEANYLDLVERLSRAFLKRSGDAAGANDPEASARWALVASQLLDRLRKAGRPIPEEVKGNLAQAYVEQGRLDDAAALYAEMLARQPESRALLRAAALLAGKRGVPAEAAGFWRRLAKAQEVATPSWYEARLSLAAALQDAGLGAEACASVREVEAFHPDLRDAPTKQRFAEMATRSCTGRP